MNSVPLSAITRGLIPDEFAPSVPESSVFAGFSDADILLQENHIAAVQQRPKSRAGFNLDASGCVVLPGFVDIHVHGAKGYDTMDGTTCSLTSMAQCFATHGVTGFLATTITAPHADTIQAVQTIAKYDSEAETGAQLLGIHLEGPYISPKYPGMHRLDYIRAPNVEEFRELLAAGPVRMITLAPEGSGAEQLIATALDNHVTVVMGHTNATYEGCLAAIETGINQATHTFNAMRGLHHRQPGTLGAVLSNDDVYAQVIVDNIHVHPAAIDILARCKGIEKTILITDAMVATDLLEGEYQFGGQKVYVSGKECRLADGTLAGSVLTMEEALRNFIDATGMPLSQAWPASSRTPLQSIGLDHRMGNIQAGYEANLVILNADLQVVATVVQGKLVYLREANRLSA